MGGRVTMFTMLIGEAICRAIREEEGISGVRFKPSSSLPSIYFSELAKYHKEMGERIRKQLKRR